MNVKFRSQAIHIVPGQVLAFTDPIQSGDAQVVMGYEQGVLAGGNRTGSSHDSSTIDQMSTQRPLRKAVVYLQCIAVRCASVLVQMPAVPCRACLIARTRDSRLMWRIVSIDITHGEFRGTVVTKRPVTSVRTAADNPPCHNRSVVTPIEWSLSDYHVGVIQNLRQVPKPQPGIHECACFLITFAG